MAIKPDTPLRIVWKAASTFEASSADVSIKDRPFSANMQLVSYRIQERKSMPTGKRLGLIRWYCTQVFQIALVAHKHDDDISVSVVPQFL